MKIKRYVPFLIIFIAVFMVCSMSVLAVTSKVIASAVSVTFSLSGESISITSDTLQLLDFSGYASGSPGFNFQISIPQQLLTQATVTIKARYQFSQNDFPYFEHGYVGYFGARYKDGTVVSFPGDSSNVVFDHSGSTWWINLTGTAIFDNISQISYFYISYTYENIAESNMRIYSKLSWFTVEFDTPASPSDEVYNDFSDFGNDANAVDGSEQQIKDNISNYQPEVNSFLNGFSTIVGEFTVPLRAVTLMINDYVSGIPFLNLILRFALSLGVVAFVLGSGVFIISKISSGVSASHRESAYAKSSARNSKGG